MVLENLYLRPSSLVIRRFDANRCMPARNHARRHRLGSLVVSMLPRSMDRSGCRTFKTVTQASSCVRRIIDAGLRKSPDSRHQNSPQMLIIAQSRRAHGAAILRAVHCGQRRSRCNPIFHKPSQRKKPGQSAGQSGHLRCFTPTAAHR